MKKIATLVIALMVAATALFGCGTADVVESYHTYAVVDSFSNVDQTVTVVRDDGHIFTHDLLSGQMPQVGDILWCEYDTCGTETVTDDYLISAEHAK